MCVLIKTHQPEIKRFSKPGKFCLRVVQLLMSVSALPNDRYMLNLVHLYLMAILFSFKGTKTLNKSWIEIKMKLTGYLFYS